MPRAVPISACVVVLLVAIQSVAPREGVTIHIKGPTRVIYGCPAGGTNQEGHEGTTTTTEATTEPDPCVSPWISIGSSGCFRFVNALMDWDNASRNCQDMGGDLATMDEESKRIDIVNHMVASYQMWRDFWVGSNCRSGSWRWVVTNNPVTSGWYKGNAFQLEQPDEDAEHKTCMDIWVKSGRRYDIQYDDLCTEKNRSICEK